MENLTPKQQVHFQLLSQLLNKADLNNAEIEFAKEKAKELTESILKKD